MLIRFWKTLICVDAGLGCLHSSSAALADMASGTDSMGNEFRTGGYIPAKYGYSSGRQLFLKVIDFDRCIGVHISASGERRCGRFRKHVLSRAG